MMHRDLEKVRAVLCWDDNFAMFSDMGVRQYTKVSLVSLIRFSIRLLR